MGVGLVSNGRGSLHLPLMPEQAGQAASVVADYVIKQLYKGRAKWKILKTSQEKLSTGYPISSTAEETYST